VFFGVLLALLAIGYMDEGMCGCCCARRETEMLVGWVHAYEKNKNDQKSRVEIKTGRRK